MAEPGKIQLVVEKQRLMDEFRRLSRVVEDYGRFLRAQPLEGDWQPAVVRLLRSHAAFLASTRTSLRTIEVVAALLREVLRRVNAERFRFALPGTDGGAGADNGLRPAGAAELDRMDLPDLIARLGGLARTAPLEQQEKLRILLAAVLRLLTAARERNEAEVGAALAQVNLLTANRESQALLRDLALITRDIYNTLTVVSEELPVESLAESSGGISDAVKKLNGVIVRLEQTAVDDLDSLDRVTRKSGPDQRALTSVIEALRKGQETLMQVKAQEPGLAEALTRLQGRLSDEVGAQAMALRYQAEQNGEATMEFISNESFHELTSQTLKKIIAFVESLEKQLFELLSHFRPVLELETAAPAAKPPPQDNEQSQDQVDKLLGELGF